MLESISKFDVYIGAAVMGIFTGLGSAIGTYLAQKHIIEGSKRLINKIKGNKQ